MLYVSCKEHFNAAHKLYNSAWAREKMSRPSARVRALTLAIQNYALQLDRTGQYSKDLFFIETVRNAKIYVKYSA